MIAYVFWHWRDPRIEEIAYQQLLINFHERLHRHKPSGFLDSAVFQMEQAPWSGMELETYEEWYILENSSAIDALRILMEKGRCKEHHERFKQWDTGGIGGLYSLQQEPLHFDCTMIQAAHWFSRPTGVTEEALQMMLQNQRQQEPGYCWRRILLLGPAPEFCWQSSIDARYLDPLAPRRLNIQTIWTRLDLMQPVEAELI